MTEGELAVIRSHIGATQPPTDQALSLAFDRLGSSEAVALEVLRGRLADMLANPTKFRAEGDFSDDYSTNVDVLSKKVAALEAELGVGGVTTSRLVRAGRAR